MPRPRHAPSTIACIFAFIGCQTVMSPLGSVPVSIGHAFSSKKIAMVSPISSPAKATNASYTHPQPDESGTIPPQPEGRTSLASPFRFLSPTDTACTYRHQSRLQMQHYERTVCDAGVWRVPVCQVGLYTWQPVKLPR